MAVKRNGLPEQKEPLGTNLEPASGFEPLAC